MIDMRVIALGQEVAGDDGAGLAVLEVLRRRMVPSGIELVEARDASLLVPLLETPAHVVIVDAAVAPRPGQIVVLRADELAECSVHDLRPVSSHGLGVAQVIGLARQLAPDRVSPSIRIVLITIARPDRFQSKLSPQIAAVLDEAADRVLAAAPSAP